MRREAHHHKSAWWKGDWTDEYVYAILAEEWPDKSNGTDPQPPAEAGGRDRWLASDVQVEEPNPALVKTGHAP